MFGTADDEEPVEKIITTSSLAFIISQDSVNNNFVIIMVDSGASDHFFDETLSAGLYASRYASQDSHCQGSSAGRYGGRRATRSYCRQLRQPKPRSG